MSLMKYIQFLQHTMYATFTQCNNSVVYTWNGHTWQLYLQFFQDKEQSKTMLYVVILTIHNKKKQNNHKFAQHLFVPLYL